MPAKPVPELAITIPRVLRILYMRLQTPPWNAQSRQENKPSGPFKNEALELFLLLYIAGGEGGHINGPNSHRLATQLGYDRKNVEAITKWWLYFDYCGYVVRRNLSADDRHLWLLPAGRERLIQLIAKYLLGHLA